MSMNGITSLMSGLWQFIQLRAGGVGEFVFFKTISDFLDHRIVVLTEGLMGRAMAWVGLVALSLLTIWIMIIGYQIVTGSFRGSMASLVTDLSKKVIIIAVAGSMSLFGANLSEVVTQDMDRGINHLINGGGDTTTSSTIDENLAYMQVAFTAIEAVEVVGDNPELRAEKSRALLFAGFGTSSPALMAGAMLIFFKFSLGFFIGLGPLFILMLLFKGTQPMFQRWLQYGIATLFAMAGLNAVTSIILDLAVRVAGAFWAAKGVNGILAIDPEGMTLQAMQQGGIGLLLTAAIVSVPAGLAAFFGGLAGNFTHFSVFGGGAGSMPGPHGQPPGSYAPPPTNAAPQAEGGNRTFGDPTHGSRVMGSSAPPSLDVIGKKSNT